MVAALVKHDGKVAVERHLVTRNFGGQNALNYCRSYELNTNGDIEFIDNFPGNLTDPVQNARLFNFHLQSVLGDITPMDATVEYSISGGREILNQLLFTYDHTIINPVIEELIATAHRS